VNNNISDHKNITLFPGLNSLRFIAAFLVVLDHGETIKRKYEMDNFEWLGLFRNGGHAVTFFFVLSGFLITYLLLKEGERTGTIKSFTNLAALFLVDFHRDSSIALCVFYFSDRL
jgi:peptidoglycan/LPS O-acetylase OafA/YrhL